MTNAEKIAQYPILVLSLSEEDGGGYEAHYPILARSVTGQGDTPEEAVHWLTTEALDGFLEAMEDEGQELTPYEEHDIEAHVSRSLRRELFDKIGSYNDKNDGFLRSVFSRNCYNRSKIYKKGKTQKTRRGRTRPPWKVGSR